MGLTIHYGLTSRTRSTAKAKALVEQMRQLALDLPFESVDDQIRHLGPDVCQRPLDDLRPDAESVLRRPGRLPACADPLASQAVGQHHRSAVGNLLFLDRFPALARNGPASALPDTRQRSK